MKKSLIIFPLFKHNELANRINENGHYELGKLSFHEFPDEEILIKVDSNVKDRGVVLITSLDRPNTKILSLLFVAETLRSLGASKIILIAPYLAYMRQDKIFEPGQGLTSQYFAKLLSQYFDGLITIDPHLHRWHALSDIYDIPAHALHATDAIAHWIHTNTQTPILIGPDSESHQWVQAIAKKANAPYLILEKNRVGDKAVEILTPNLKPYRYCQPVLIDDIISTGTTLMKTLEQLATLKMLAPICIGVHAVFAGDAYQQLLAMGVKKIITCNTIPHVSNGIDLSHEIGNLLKSYH